MGVYTCNYVKQSSSECELTAPKCTANECCQHESIASAGFAVVLFDDAIVLTRQQPTVTAFQGLRVLPYLFGVAVYAFEVTHALNISKLRKYSTILGR